MNSFLLVSKINNKPSLNVALRIGYYRSIISLNYNEFTLIYPY
jgi:hypothetical protein